MKKLLISFSLAVISSMTVGASELVPVLQESFAKSSSSVIQGGYFAESNYFEADELADNSGWSTNQAYQSERAIKFNAKTKHGGYAVTPALDFSTTTASTVVVRFRAQRWDHKDDHVTVHVSVDGDNESVQDVEIENSGNVSDRSAEPFELTFTNVADGSRIRFTATMTAEGKVDRWFLADVSVLEQVETPAAPKLWTSAGYMRFADIMGGDESEVHVLKVEGTGCGEDIAVTLPEDAAFAVEKAAWDARRGGELRISFDPLRAGVAEQTMTLRCGDAERTVVLRGKAKVYAPVAEAATDVEETAFTAHWGRVACLENIVLDVYTKEEGTPVSSDLMFTKYIEGSSNNRAVEIFNGTGHEVSLAGYCLRMESNASGAMDFGEYHFADGAKIAAGGTYTVCNAQYGALRDIADATIGFSDGGYANIMTFTGDDAIGLFAPDGHLVDILGYESCDVNDEVGGNWGQDKTFYRKATSYEPSDKFNAAEWDEYPKDYCEGYGTHTLAATCAVKRPVKQMVLERGTTSARVDGIPAGTPCYYTVQGLSGGLKTLVSAEIEVKNAGAGISDVTSDGNGPVRYYNLQGIGEEHPAAGALYIRVQGGKAAKVAY